MDQDSAGRHSAANRKEWRKAGGNTLIQQSRAQSLHNSLRSWQISTYVGKIVNATGPRIFVGGGGKRGPEYMVQPLGRSMPLAEITS